MSIIILSRRGNNYYISPDGNDANSGTSPAFPWRTFTNINMGSFPDQAQFLFQSGRTFADFIDFRSRATAVSPFVFGAYGEGDRPTITSITDQYGLYAEGGGVQVRDLIFSGPGDNDFSVGVNIDAGTNNGALTGVLIDNVEVSGYKAGIACGCDPANHPGAGTGYFDGLSVTSSLCHDNQVYGVWFYGHSAAFADGIFRVRNFTIDDVEAYDNPGTTTADPTYGTAPGFSIEAAQTGTVKNWLSARNGKRGAGGVSGVGIQTINADAITIQDGEVDTIYMTTDTNNDGMALDFDSGTTNSIMQRNYAHDCDGHGAICFQSATPDRAHSTNVIRYNRLIDNNKAITNDGGQLAFAGGGTISGLKAYNNTMYSATTNADVIRLSAATFSDVLISNNIVYGAAATQLLLNVVGDPSGVTFTGNDWFAGGGATNKFRWNSTNYTSLANIQATVTSFEKISGSNVGLTSDPLLVNPATDQHLQAGSPMIDAGINLTTEYGLSVGSTDYYGGTIPLGSGYDVGAHEKA